MAKVDTYSWDFRPTPGARHPEVISHVLTPNGYVMRAYRTGHGYVTWNVLGSPDWHGRRAPFPHTELIDIALAGVIPA